MTKISRDTSLIRDDAKVLVKYVRIEQQSGQQMLLKEERNVNYLI